MRQKILLFICLCYCFFGLRAQNDEGMDLSTPYVGEQGMMKALRPNFREFEDRELFITQELVKLSNPASRTHPEFGILPYNAPCSDCIELIEKRTQDSRYFVKSGSDGDHFYVQQAAGPLHFRNGKGEWQSLDEHLYPTDEAGRYRAGSQPLPTQINVEQGWSSIHLKDGTEWINNADQKLQWISPEGDIQEIGITSLDCSVGKDGALAKSHWPGIDLVQEFGLGEIKTNYLIQDASSIGNLDGWYNFVDFFHLPDNISIERAGGETDGDLWRGSYELKRGDLVIGKIDPAYVYDIGGSNSLQEPGIWGYKLEKTDFGYRFETRVSAAWLSSSERSFPIVIDPLLYGTATYGLGDIGFNYDAMCFDVTDYCNAFMTVIVPGQTTLTGAWFWAQYESTLGGCVAAMADCLMRDAAFQIIGPCSTSPMPGSYWTCLPPEGDSSGTCYGDSLDMFNTIDCIPPSCPDHVLDFEMRTFMCSCNGPNCGVICHYMPNNTWIITIEGRTVEEDPITSFNFPDFEICEGDTIALVPSAQWGVPPYEFQWSPGGAFADTLWVNPLISTTYTSVVFDECLNSDTVDQLVTVNPAPNPLLGPFEDCVPDVLLDAGSGWLDYFWPHSGETSQTVIVDVPGDYLVVVTDALGCSGVSQPITAVINAPPVVDAFPDTIIIDEGALAQLSVISLSGGAVSYEWSPPGTLTSTTGTGPLAFPSDDQIYYVVGTENGCEGLPDSILVLVNQVDLNIPNAFTPDGDGLNDIFRVTNPVLYPVFEMSVYTRWGQRIFFSSDIRTGWDGTFKGREQEIGTYIWMIRYRKGSETGEEVILQGNVTLLR